MGAATVGGRVLRTLTKDVTHESYYAVAGGAGVFALGPLSHCLPTASLSLVIAGGAAYVVGIAFYLWKSLQFHNVIWHGFVAGASALHFAAVASAS